MVWSAHITISSDEARYQHVIINTLGSDEQEALRGAQECTRIMTHDADVIAIRTMPRAGTESDYATGKSVARGHARFSVRREEPEAGDNE